VDGVQLLCRRLVAAGAPAATAGAVLRAAVLPKARALTGAAPQPLVECLQAAGAQPRAGWGLRRRSPGARQCIKVMVHGRFRSLTPTWPPLLCPPLWPHLAPSHLASTAPATRQPAAIRTA
jgi:hypothetical protein